MTSLSFLRQCPLNECSHSFTTYKAMDFSNGLSVHCAKDATNALKGFSLSLSGVDCVLSGSARGTGEERVKETMEGRRGRAMRKWALQKVI